MPHERRIEFGMNAIGLLLILSTFAMLDAAERVDPNSAIPGYIDPCMIHLGEGIDLDGEYPFPDKYMTAFRQVQDKCSTLHMSVYFGYAGPNKDFHSFSIKQGNITFGQAPLGKCTEDAWYIFKSLNRSLYWYELLEYDPRHGSFRQMTNFSIASVIRNIRVSFGHQIDMMFECDSVPLRPSEVVLDKDQPIKWIDFDSNREDSAEVPNVPDAIGIQLNDDIELDMDFWDKDHIQYLRIKFDTYHRYGEIDVSSHNLEYSGDDYWYGKIREDVRYYGGSTSVELHLNPLHLIVRTNGTVTANFSYSYPGADPTRKVSYHNVKLTSDDKKERIIINFYSLPTTFKGPYHDTC
ncbi:hypothetical protein CAPTEDRAFT_206578 [Capitella teleta]|uniref:Uncharacterized protein n=1 Tax=Capitella teleta TaxID=283909 RepID=R7UBH4_CAPTE|nr:hypothetical protein CAPTEDRAFT_206578 [Capitella teleta]|eukprot:ELU00617.1 hypothetical protein CAPTEDRAFT_206578 [Capitella teleta]